MAQQDTGMGWSVLDSYYKDGVGMLGTVRIAEPLRKDFPFFATITGAAVVNAGKYFLKNGTPVYCAAHAGDAGSGVEAFIYPHVVSGTTRIRFVFVSDTPGSFSLASSTGMVGYYNDTTRAYSFNHSGRHYYTKDDATGLYYYEFSNYPDVADMSGDNISSGTIAVYSSFRDGMNALVGTVKSYFKLNTGAALACMAQYVDMDGETVTTPVLISTKFSSTVLSEDGISPAPNAVSYTYNHDGLKFYMTMVPSLIGNGQISEQTVPISNMVQAAAATPQKVFALLASNYYGNIIVTVTTDPYNPFGHSSEGGGDPNPDPGDDDIDDPALPTMSFAASGFCRIYRADLTSLRALARYMWTDDTFLQTLVNHAIQLIENPMDSVIALNMLPVSLSGYYTSAEAVSVMFIPTTSAMWPMTTQFIPVDCGTLNLEEVYGSALDYNPYTKVDLFLPYIGTVHLDTDEVMGKTLSLKYKVDVVSGLCVAVLKAGNDVRYQFSGHCAIPMPLSSADFTGYIQAAMGIGKLVTGAAISAGGAPVGGGLLSASPVENGVQQNTTTSESSKVTTLPTTYAQNPIQNSVKKEAASPAIHYGELAHRTVANTIGAVMNSKLGVEHSGGFSGNSGYMGVRRPFITIKRPRMCNPEEYGQFNGYPSMIYENLGACTGYTEVQSVQLTGIDALNSELSEIASLLKSGVIL